MPPSFGGTSRCVRTRKPRCSSRARVEASRRRFWKLPPESTTVRGSPASTQASRRGGRDRLVEPAQRPPRAAAPPRAPSDRCHQLRWVAEAPRVRLGGRFAGELLELDRRLALVRDALADAEHRGDRVEQAAHPARERRVELQALAHLRPFRPRHVEPRTLEVHGGDAPGLADRRLAAGQRHRLEVREPLEAGEVAAQQLAAPERPVGAVAGPVEDERERGAGLAVLGEASGGVGVVVLARRRARRPAPAPTSSPGTRGAGRGRRARARRRSIAR